MERLVIRIAAYVTFILFILTWTVTSRHLHYDASELVSDGVSDGSAAAREEESFLRLGGTASEEHCEQMYGFLPCSSNVPGHIFLIVIYEYLLYHAESYAGGDGRIFRVFGKNFFVSSLSQLLDALPDSLILLATGLSTSKEKAQEYVVTGAGLLAGSSILLLTLLWGVCFICCRTDLYVKPTPRVEKQGILFKVKRHAIHLFTGSGVLTDAETKYHAKVMFYSLIPFVVILLPSVFGLSYSSQEYEIVLLVSLLVSVICLFCYFVYQYFDDRIRNRRLEYAEVEHKVEMHVPFYEVQSLMLDREKHLIIRQKTMEKELKNPKTGKTTMTMENFYHMFEIWLDDTKQFMDDPYSFDNSGTEYNQVAELLLEEKHKLMELVSLMEQKLLEKYGTQDDSAIEGLFNSIDTDKNKSITPSELKKFIMGMNYDEIRVDEAMADIIMRHLDIDGNGNIELQEFVSGLKKWLMELRKRSSKAKKCKQDKPKEKAEAEPEKKAETVAVAKEKAKAKTKADEKYKAIILLFVGIFFLTVLAEPLVESVQKFSESVNIEPFFVSFILVPLATNARTAIAAIRAAKQKRHYTTSLTFSEIYHKVFMNNVQGFSVLVSVIYFRGLTWHFSAEIIVVIVVCIIMGLLTSFKSKFENWTMFIAFPLYLLSLVAVYFVNDAFQFT